MIVAHRFAVEGYPVQAGASVRRHQARLTGKIMENRCSEREWAVARVLSCTSNLPANTRRDGRTGPDPPPGNGAQRGERFNSVICVAAGYART